MVTIYKHSDGLFLDILLLSLQLPYDVGNVTIFISSWGKCNLKSLLILSVYDSDWGRNQTLIYPVPTRGHFSTIIFL